MLRLPQTLAIVALLIALMAYGPRPMGRDSTAEVAIGCVRVGAKP